MIFTRLIFVIATLLSATLLPQHQLSSQESVQVGSHLVQEPAQKAAEVPNEQLRQPELDYYDIGSFSYPVTTQSNEAQLWFDRGLAMCIAFNHEEGIRCFRKAMKTDPGMSMAYWGLAYAMGPNINNLEIDSHQLAQAQFALELANLHSEQCTERERRLISALAKRCETPAPPVEERGPLNRSYSDAMRELYTAHPDDSLVVALHAEALMILRPWGHWTKDGNAAKETPEILSVLERGLKKWPSHPALCHFYIHAMEASPHPEKAFPAANRLRDAMPGAGHLVHMPSHIDVLVGDYESVIKSNQAAIEADKEFLRREGPYNFYTLYRVHNYHFLVYGAMFDGQRELAETSARELVKQVPEEMLKSQTDFLDAFMQMPLHVMIRFGQWDAILSEPKPADYLPASMSIWHYARAVAFAAKGNVKEAEKEQAAFHSARSKVPESSILFNNSSLSILGVAEKMIAGEIEYRKGNWDKAFALLREAVERDDALNYDEPWGWMQPARHALGALLLEQKRFAEAETVYRNDLKRHPKNPWSLHGLASCLEANGGSAKELKLTQAAFREATKRSDVKIDRSCFCKNSD